MVQSWQGYGLGQALANKTKPDTDLAVYGSKLAKLRSWTKSS